MPRKKRDMQRINVYLPCPIIRFLKTTASKKGITFSELLRAILVAYLKQLHSEQMKETSKNDSLP